METVYQHPQQSSFQGPTTMFWGSSGFSISLLENGLQQVRCKAQPNYPQTERSISKQLSKSKDELRQGVFYANSSTQEGVHTYSLTLGAQGRFLKIWTSKQVKKSAACGV